MIVTDSSLFTTLNNKKEKILHMCDLDSVNIKLNFQSLNYGNSYVKFKLENYGFHWSNF